MAEYHNPYHFVPVKPGQRPDDLSKEDFPLRTKHVTHDRYHPDTYSGRIICRLTTESPIFVGAQQKRDPSQEIPGKVAPFELNEQPAIPASTLRGLISSLVEAASNSSLRVLEEEPYSFRQNMKDSLSAIGMIIIERDDDDKPQLDENGNYRCLLRPLTLPTLEIKGGLASLPSSFGGMFPTPNLKVYIGDKDSIRCGDFSYITYCRDREQYYGLKLREREWDAVRDGRHVLSADESQNIKKGKYLIAQRPLKDEEPRPWEEIPEKERGEYTRGILRILGCSDREDIPDNKKHEIFIPYPEKAESWDTCQILPEAVERFHDLADQRTKASEKNAKYPWPYEPKGTKRNPEPGNRNFRLKDGDLVYFKPHGPRKIERISLSSIWRDRVEISSGQCQKRATACTFFEKVDAELLPFNGARKVLTIAEQMFGFVESEKSVGQEAALALAGRLYFSHACIEGIRKKGSTEWVSDDRGLSAPYLPAVTLKILDSPKPPCPALYFKEAKGVQKYITKENLTPGRHHPQGRKFYLHHFKSGTSAGAEPWRSNFQANKPHQDIQDLKECRFKQKMEVTPLQDRAVFYFHIDFDNFSKRELGLLLYALKPTGDFRHKIGMGKPIGLGQINIEPVGIFRIDRQQRYTFEGFSGARYSEGWIAGDENRNQWPDRYTAEKEAKVDGLDKDEIQEDVRNSLDADIRQAIELLGNPSKLRVRVHTPLVDNCLYGCEDKTFRWFVAANKIATDSDRTEDQFDTTQICLEPLNRNSKGLPTLVVLPGKGSK